MTLSGFVAAAAWGSLFCLSWFLIMGQVPSNFVSWFLWSFFLIVGLLSGWIAASVSFYSVKRRGK